MGEGGLANSLIIEKLWEFSYKCDKSHIKLHIVEHTACATLLTYFITPRIHLAVCWLDDLSLFNPIPSNSHTASSPVGVYLVYNAYKNVIRSTEAAKWPQDHPSSISLSVTWLKESTLGRLTNLTYLWPSDQPAPLSAWESSMCSSANCASVGGWESSCTRARTHCSTVKLCDCEQLGCARTAMCAIVHLFCSHCVRVMIKLCTDCVPEAVLASQNDLTHWSLVSLVQLLLCSMFIIWITVCWSQKAPFFATAFHRLFQLRQSLHHITGLVDKGGLVDLTIKSRLLWLTIWPRTVVW